MEETVPTLSAGTRSRSKAGFVETGSTRSGLVRTAVVVSLSHALVDAYAGVLPPLLPRIMDKLGLSIALAATLAMTFSLASSLLQPILGWIADHYGRRMFIVGGPLLSGIFVSLIGTASTFEVLLGLLIVAGLGSAAFHPPGASLAARVGDGTGSGARLSAFSFSGALGYALGPIAAVALVAQRGLEGMWLAMAPALLLAPLALLALPRGAGAREPHPRAGLRVLLPWLAGPLGVLFVISALGAFVQRVYVTLAPIIVAQAGGAETTGAIALSTYLGAQALGTVFGGILSDRVDRRRLLIGLTLGSVPAHALAFWLAPGSVGGLAAAAASGFLNMAMIPPVVVMAQEMLPTRAALGSGIVMGLAWAVGSVGVIGIGALADVVGPRPAALMALPLLFVATALAAHPSLAPHARDGGHAREA